MKATTLELCANLFFSAVLSSSITLEKEESCESSRFQWLPETHELVVYFLSLPQEWDLSTHRKLLHNKGLLIQSYLAFGIGKSYVEVCQISILVFKWCCFHSLVTGPQKSGSMSYTEYARCLHQSASASSQSWGWKIFQADTPRS